MVVFCVTLLLSAVVVLTAAEDETEPITQDTSNSTSVVEQCSISKLRRGEHYTCEEGEKICDKGWTGEFCDVPVCSGGCHPLFGHCVKPDECACRFGWNGKSCDSCMVLPGCLHGYCNTSLQCICEEGWDGLFCSQPICKESCPLTRAYCMKPGECQCRLGWKGELCSKCQVLPGCKHGSCRRPLECLCEPGWTGVFCDKPICSKGCHPTNGFCEVPDTCKCKVGWWGENCDKCFPYPGCKNGNCSGPWECNCEPGWGGYTCEEEVSYCEDNPNPCLNNGTCVSVTKKAGSFKCQCSKKGSTGRLCDEEVTSINSYANLFNPFQWIRPGTPLRTSPAFIKLSPF